MELVLKNLTVKVYVSFLKFETSKMMYLKALPLMIITMIIVLYPLMVFPIDAQCYGCGQNSTVLKQALLEKQMEELKQKNEQLSQDSQIITLLAGILIALGCFTGIVIRLKTRVNIKK
jgi:ABC-type uncharacterized transport system permease subunit